jgi:hypothetical protein
MTDTPGIGRVPGRKGDGRFNNSCPKTHRLSGA